MSPDLHHQLFHTSFTYLSGTYFNTHDSLSTNVPLVSCFLFSLRTSSNVCRSAFNSFSTYLYAVHWDIILSIILITLSKKYFNLFIMMLGESMSTKRVLPQVFNEMGGLNVFITYKELWKQHVSHYRSTWTTAHILSCLFWNFFVYLGQLQPAYILILSYIWQWYLVYLHLAIGCYPD